MKILYYAISDCGKVRKENQDRYVVPHEGTTYEVTETSELPLVFAVFDGMGGDCAFSVLLDVAQLSKKL